MTSTITRQPLRVMTDSSGGPYIKVPADQRKAVEQLLTAKGVRCWADEDVYSYDGQPAFGFINLGKAGNAMQAQAVLDSAP